MKETKEVIGEIQNIRKDFKAIQINNIWYSSFFVIDDFIKGDNIKLTYRENKKDNKTFLNIISIEKNKQEEKLNNEKIEIPRETFNTLIIRLVNLYNDPKNNNDIEECAEVLVKGYKKIKSLI